MSIRLLIEKILGKDNGAIKPDTLSTAYPKINRNFEQTKIIVDDTRADVDNQLQRLAEVEANSKDGEVLAARGAYPSLKDRLNSLDPGLMISRKTFTATEGQTVFDISDVGQYSTGQNRLAVVAGGVPQFSGIHFTETSSTSFTLSEGVAAGISIIAEWYEGAISLLSGHGRKHQAGGGDELHIATLAGYDAFTEQLADIVSQPLSYNDRGKGLSTTISSAFPSVTLADVQSLNPSATLSDTADWYVLQKLINDGDANGYKRLNFPVGAFMVSKPVNFTGKLSNCVITATGCYIKPATGYMGELVKLNRGGNYAKARNLTIDGLALDGLFKSTIGILINDTNEWYFTNLKIYNCFVGVQLTDTYYGEISGESVIQDCLTGIKTVAGTAGEVNTIEFNNIKINFATDKRNFIPQNAGETDADYNIRVVSKGVELTTMIMGCKFNGLTLEAMDYGYYGTQFGSSGTTNASIFGINQNYFEAIKNQPIYIVSFSGFGIITFNVSIEQCRFYNKPTCTIGQGEYRIFGNEQFYLTVKESGAYRTLIDTDLPSSYIKARNDNPYILIRRHNIPTSANALKYNSFSNTDVTPAQTNMLPTIQDELAIEHTPRIRTSGRRSQNPQVFGIHTKPLTFVGNGAAPVIQGVNGNYYMLTTVDGTSLVLKQVLNLFRIDNPVGGMTSKELYRRVSVTGEKFYNVDIQQEVEYKDGKWKQRIGQANEMIAFGTTSELVSTTPPSPNSYYNPLVCNVQIDGGYNWQGTYWAWTDWYGNNYTSRAIGTLAQRPADPNIHGFIYFATDNNTYYKWDDVANTYSVYNPLF